MTKKMVLDADFVRFAVASAGEKASIVATNKKTGDQYPFKTRTEFWGRSKKEIGGWLQQYNVDNELNLTKDDFDIEDIYIREPISNVLNSAKEMTRRILRESKCDTMVGFLGKGDSFRLERSTILKYKGNRDDKHRPLALEEVGHYMMRTFGFEEIVEIESDDACIIEAYKDKNAIVVGVDKDIMGSPVLSYNPNYPDMGISNGDCLGELWIKEIPRTNAKTGKVTIDREVKGYGRKFMYWQMLTGDNVDNYKANSANPTFEWGDMSGYKLLQPCKTDKECLETLVGGYKKIYPDPVGCIGWRGDNLTVDWRYALNENWEMVRMLRTMDEYDNRITADMILERYGIT